MIVFPAIDLRQGKCVRLVQGRPEEQTIVSENPVATASLWSRAGAEWLHVVNLDGAFGDVETSKLNIEALAAILEAVPTPVQLGGGLRTMADIEMVLTMGVRRAILGTAALHNPDLVQEAVEKFGKERIVLAIDVRDEQVATHGWQQLAGLSAIDLALQMKGLGIRRVVYTDIARDGTLTGVNAASCAALASESGLSVIASGGVASLEDVKRVKAVENLGVEGVIIGKALYAGQVDLGQALAMGRGETC
jgi:phosphoribosylformimino-5-aminoimidazole carboxamide ribotide isomerase